MTVPQITESMIRQRASSQSWQRGVRYLKDDSVNNVTWRGTDAEGVLAAEVFGSDYDPYEIRISFHENEINHVYCSCPFDFGGDCKHIVATLLFLQHSPNEVEERPTVAGLIENLDREQLITLLKKITELQPSIIDAIEELVETIGDSSSVTASSTDELPDLIPPINENLLRRQIRGDMRNSIDTGYDGWGGESWYDSDLSSALNPAVSHIRALLDADQIDRALSVLEIATDAWDDAANSLDDYFYEYFSESDAEFLSDLNSLWTEAVLRANFSREERIEWAEKLEKWAETIFCGAELEMATRAAYDGWEYPPLVAAMEGKITEKGAWEGDAPHFADELALIRINLLEHKGDYQAALHLAEAEGQYLRYMQMLIKMRQSDKAIVEAKEVLKQPGDIHAVARTLLEVGEIEKALDIGQYGLTLEASKQDHMYSYWGFDAGKADLAEWLRDAAVTHDPELALTIAKKALQLSVSLNNYLRIQEVAGDNWESLKPEILSYVHNSEPSEQKVDIYLYEHMYKEVVQTVDGMRFFYDIDKVLDAVQNQFPEWAFRQCTSRAESIMDEGRAKYYDDAAEWLRRGREILLPAGLEKIWSTYINAVMEKHQRKYKLMPMLKAIA